MADDAWYAQAARRVVLSAAALVMLASAAALAQGGPPGARGGTTIKDGEECPPGMTEVRPRNCRAPELPAPSILA